MKKLILTGVIAAVAVLVLAGAGLAYASANDLSAADVLSGVGRVTRNTEMLHRRSGGPLDDYVRAALADAFDISLEDLDARLAAGDSLLDIAEEQGLTVEQFQAMLAEAHQAAIQLALADGAITADQAEQLQAMAGYGPHAFGDPAGFGPGEKDFGPGGFGPGNGPGDYSFGPGYGPGEYGFGPGEMGFGPGGFGPGIELAAAFLDTTVEELQARIQAGETFEEILAAEGATLEEFARYAADAKIAEIEAAVAAGDLAREQADEIIAHIEEMIENGGPILDGPHGPGGWSHGDQDHGMGGKGNGGGK